MMEGGNLETNKGERVFPFYFPFCKKVLLNIGADQNFLLHISIWLLDRLLKIEISICGPFSSLFS